MNQDIINPSVPSQKSVSNSPLCVVCQTDEKSIACIPCGHRAMCVPCGYSLNKCPVCRKDIAGFIKIYL
ncbi:unnamed protein product [Didymodactylos carnosus]|uniref:RING-type domain-containing protein n=1 Tax=Didymodactylos carnosus TaxID=1234261 RepID=A0A816AQV6_9BILA|nr:unnamed protein product [Didymodactylos carnosus]CAF1600153.1 unnamed protein product [Didymodactylos carnosus]CAF4044610.1 unnamed protein product [Didymodactylos carnosus]CAF4476985.1 unnamed protein product [Didymodactylos carnosus]